MPDERRAGFLALRTPRAADISSALRARDVFIDARGDILRIGPAPYLDDQQLDDGVARRSARSSAICDSCFTRRATVTRSHGDDS